MGLPLFPSGPPLVGGRTGQESPVFEIRRNEEIVVEFCNSLLSSWPCSPSINSISAYDGKTLHSMLSKESVASDFCRQNSII
jgi:hypothetical protein